MLAAALTAAGLLLDPAVVFFYGNAVQPPQCHVFLFAGVIACTVCRLQPLTVFFVCSVAYGFSAVSFIWVASIEGAVCGSPLFKMAVSTGIILHTRFSPRSGVL